MDAAPPDDAPRRPRRAVALVAVVTTAAALAVAVPVALADRHEHAADDLRADLQRVATAQASWKAAHGEFSTSLTDLGVDADRDELAIVSAGTRGFCAGAHDDGTGTTVFYSPGAGFSDRSCA
ncbi:hypothetical protein [Kineococcus rhizosphaerae]|uniref:Uncharacterized protein n=1 Tax=Kineococcus rhizosphaerae TaxID=559628 RepID=A0A2T0R9W6_9ACTN|nr:hypothetical protein [Kineococcus rhizosphaerae]PRY17921.1 hypothetical protein CLV37_101163 [Kineococcus rhizosphaerae]